MRKSSASVFIAALTFAGSVAAQAPTAPRADPKLATPAAAPTQSTGPRHSTPSRDQVFSPVMGIDIEGEGLALPNGGAEEEPIIKPAAEPPPAAPAPASTPNPTGW